MALIGKSSKIEIVKNGTLLPAITVDMLALNDDVITNMPAGRIEMLYSPGIRPINEYFSNPLFEILFGRIKNEKMFGFIIGNNRERYYHHGCYFAQMWK